MSSTSPGHGATLAIDGSYDSMSPHFEACDCCSATMGTEKPWWQIDIGRQILIQEMYIIGSQRGKYIFTMAFNLSFCNRL